MELGAMPPLAVWNPLCLFFALLPYVAKISASPLALAASVGRRGSLVTPSPPTVWGVRRGSQPHTAGGERIPLLLSLRGGGKKNKGMGRRVRQLHNYIPKQRRADENPLQINKPHRRRKKAKERHAAHKKIKNVQNSVKTGEGREELFNHGLVDTPEMTAKSRLSDNFIDMANLNDDEAPSSSEGMEPDEESRESNDSGGEDEQQKKFDRMCRELGVPTADTPEDQAELVKGMEVSDSVRGEGDSRDDGEGRGEEGGSDSDEESDEEGEGWSSQGSPSKDTSDAEGGEEEALDYNGPPGGVGEGWVPTGPAARPSPYAVLAKGDIVVYVNQHDGTTVRTKVTTVDLSIDPPSYEVIVNGSYRETVRGRLRFIERPLPSTVIGSPVNSTAAAAPRGWVDPSTRFIDPSRGWVHESLGKWTGPARERRAGEMQTSSDDEDDDEDEDEDEDERMAGVSKVVEPDERFSMEKLEKLNMISGAARRRRHAMEDAELQRSIPTPLADDETVGIMESIREAREKDAEDKIRYEAEYRERAGWGSSAGAKARARTDAVRSDHRFRRYGR